MLLTILVPTYNRAVCLESLLTSLVTELRGLEHQISVVVSDNASTDRTPAVVDAFKTAFPSAVSIRHPTNLGPDENFCSCIEKVESRYFWIIGDDDVPRAGFIRLLAELLSHETADLIYLRPGPRESLAMVASADTMPPLEPVTFSRIEFARKVHVQSTFISTMVVNLEAYRSIDGMRPLRRFAGTSLVQLGWVFDLLKAGSRFIYIPAVCVLTMHNNSGGYSFLKVFGNNFPVIVRKTFGDDSAISRSMIRRCAIKFFPIVLWQLRFDTIGNFEYEEPSRVLRPQLGSFLSYWLLLLPISRLPRIVAWLPFQAARMASHVISVKDLSLAWLTRSAVKP